MCVCVRVDNRINIGVYTADHKDWLCVCACGADKSSLSAETMGVSLSSLRPDITSISVSPAGEETHTPAWRWQPADPTTKQSDPQRWEGHKHWKVSFQTVNTACLQSCLHAPLLIWRSAFWPQICANMQWTPTAKQTCVCEPVTAEILYETRFGLLSKMELCRHQQTVDFPLTEAHCFSPDVRSNITYN